MKAIPNQGKVWHIERGVPHRPNIPPEVVCRIKGFDFLTRKWRVSSTAYVCKGQTPGAKTERGTPCR
eukprot:1862032-Lingulodinium_polyedra.AAC.1